MLWKNNDPFPPFLHYPVAVQKHSPEDFLLCDVIGKPIQQPDGAIKWETECRRSVAPWECPLLLVDMWRPKDGFERRFEIQRKEDYEREEREREKEREREGESYQGTVCVGLNRDTASVFRQHRVKVTDAVMVSLGNRRALAAKQDVIRGRCGGK